MCRFQLTDILKRANVVFVYILNRALRTQKEQQHGSLCASDSQQIQKSVE